MPRNRIRPYADLYPSIRADLLAKYIRQAKKGSKTGYAFMKFALRGSYKFDVVFKTDGSEEIIEYVSELTFEDKVSHPSGKIHLTTAPCHFGGSRIFFLCPIFGKRCSTLYFYRGEFVCREATDLQYRSQSQSAIDRLREKRKRLEKRLFDSKGCRRNMRHKTRLRILEQMDEIDDIVDQHFFVACKKFLSRRGLSDMAERWL